MLDVSSSSTDETSEYCQDYSAQSRNHGRVNRSTLAEESIGPQDETACYGSGNTDNDVHPWIPSVPVSVAPHGFAS